VVDLDTSVELVEVVASGSSDSLGRTIVGVTPPATTTSDLRTIARLLTSLKLGGIAEENIREAVDVLSEPALRVVHFLIRHNGKREGNTLKVRSSRGNGNVVGVRSGKEDNLSTKTAVIIIRCNASHTRTVVIRVLILVALRVHIDDGIVDSR